MLIDFLAALPESELAQVTVVPGIHWNARETMEHIITAERSYLEQIAESAMGERGLRLNPSGEWPALRGVALANGRAFTQAASTLVADPIQRRVFDGEPYELRTSFLIVQAINHATEYRSQIRMLLSANGIIPPEIGVWHWERALDPATPG